jgi:hypothetical protein
MMNILLYVGLFLIVGGFCLFLFSQMRLRQLDLELFKNEQLTKSFNKAKQRELSDDNTTRKTYTRT